MFEVKSNGITVEFGASYEAAMIAFTASAAKDCVMYKHLSNGNKIKVLWR